MSKVCTKCGENKELNEYHFDKSCLDGRRACCRDCRNNQARGKPRAKKKLKTAVEAVEVVFADESYKIGKVAKKVDKWTSNVPDSPLIESPAMIHEVAKPVCQVQFPTPTCDIQVPRAGSYTPNPNTTISLHSPKNRGYSTSIPRKRKEK